MSILLHCLNVHIHILNVRILFLLAEFLFTFLQYLINGYSLTTLCSVFIVSISQVIWRHKVILVLRGTKISVIWRHKILKWIPTRLNIAIFLFSSSRFYVLISRWLKLTKESSYNTSFFVSGWLFIRIFVYICRENNAFLPFLNLHEGCLFCFSRNTEFPLVYSYLQVFRPILKLKVEFTIEDLESALLTPNSLLEELHIVLLKVHILGITSLEIDTFVFFLPELSIVAYFEISSLIAGNTTH